MKANCYLKNGQYTIELGREDESDDEFIEYWFRAQPDITDQIHYARNSPYNSITLTKDM